MANVQRTNPQEKREGERKGEITRREDQRGLIGGFDPFGIMREMLSFDPFRPMAPMVGGGGRAFIPQFEVKETRDGYVFKADMPGIKEEDLDIALDGNRLTISGHREEERREEEDRYFTYERSYGTFSRSFVLPEGVDPDKIEADLKDGVLKLSVPKTEEHKPRRISLRGAAHQVKEALGGKKGE